MNIVAELERAGGAYLSGSKLARSSGLTRAAIHKRIQGLRKLGYRISGTPRSGYRLDDSSDILNPDSIDGPLGRPFHRFPVLPSTQEEAKRLALEGAAEGTLVLSEVQTLGRGRMGRTWKSPKGGLWFSLVLRPPLSPSRAPALPLVAALSLSDVVRRVTGLDARVKWPNDVWIDNRKVAGFLTEMSSETDRVQWMVLGVGVNVNNVPPRGTRVPSDSLKRSLGRSVRRQEILAEWLADFDRNYRRFLRDGFAPFRPTFERGMMWRNRGGTCAVGPKRWRGVILGVDEAGRLLFKTTRGERMALDEGEIRFTPSRPPKNRRPR